MKVHRSAFTPPPKVMSAIVHVVPGEAPDGVSMRVLERVTEAAFGQRRKMLRQSLKGVPGALAALDMLGIDPRSEEHTSELQSLMRTSYAVSCLKKKKTNTHIKK